MFEINKDEMMKKQAELEARRMLSKMMSEAILESDTAPESVKLSVRVMDKSQDLTDSIHELTKRFVNPSKRADTETLKKVLEYLGMVEVGIQQFVESTPFVPADDDNEEEE
jgi:hypothetical protein